MSQLLLRIDSALLVEADPQRKAVLLAQKACYWARVGKFNEAKELIDLVRQSFGDGRSGKVTVLVMLAEALRLHFEQLGTGARDRVVRAQFLSQAMKDAELIGLTSAWMGFLNFEASKFDAAARDLQTALDSAASTDHSTHSRCAVVLFNAFAFCGNKDAAQRWFLSGRDHALKEGDQATIDALLHSRAAFGVAWLRAQRCKTEIELESLKLARSEINSARNLQLLTQVTAHSSFIDLADARLHVLESKYVEAALKLRAIREAGPFPAGHFSKRLVDTEIAFCLANAGQIEEAIETIGLSDSVSLDGLDVDDRLVAVWMLRELSRIDPRFGSQQAATSQLENALAEYGESLTAMKVAMANFAGN